jgi:hypothetical protein
VSPNIYTVPKMVKTTPTPPSMPHFSFAPMLRRGQAELRIKR